LVAICDDPFLYIHTRRKKKIERERFESEASQVYEWAPAGRIQLESQRQADNSQMRGSFALSFSKSGQYLAVATQYGIISVFDTQSLTEGGSLMVWFTTSRPSRQTGAIRAIEFCPGPYDLLVSAVSRLLAYIMSI
jgi:WD40 repeat protein